MCLARRSGLVIFIGIAALSLSSCASRLRPVVRGKHPASQALLTATKADLIKRIADDFAILQSFSAVLDMQASVGSVYNGQIRDYTEISAFIDFSKPANIRVVGLIPVVRTTAFHMVSDGQTFKVHLVPQKRFIEGRNDAPATSKNKFENIRPQTFLSAMLVQPVDTVNEYSLLADDTTETTAFYQLAVIRKIGTTDIAPHRRISFDRVNFQITEQREYAEDGSIISLTRYDDYKIYNNVRFPSHIAITRPKDEYGIVLVIQKMEINKPVPNSKFVLDRPEGTELQVIGGPLPQ